MTSKKEILQNIYQKLFDYYGPQNWWPAQSTFEMMVGAILTQNTSWQNVKKALENLKKAQMLDAFLLHKLEAADLAPLIQSAGYFNVKSKRLKNLIHFLVNEYEVDFSRMREESLSTLREKILSVKGVGPETADSILLYGLEKLIFVIDQYTYRVLTRHDLVSEEADYQEMQDFMMKNLPEDIKLYNEYHALLVRVGNQFCKPKAQCEQCPLNGVNGHQPPVMDKM